MQQRHEANKNVDSEFEKMSPKQPSCILISTARRNTYYKQGAMVMTFLLLFTVILGVGINIIHLVQMRALSFKVHGIFPRSMKVVGWDLNLGLHIRKSRLLATNRDISVFSSHLYFTTLLHSLASSVQNPQILRVSDCVFFTECNSLLLCSKTPSRCLKFPICTYSSCFLFGVFEFPASPLLCFGNISK